MPEFAAVMACVRGRSGCAGQRWAGELGARQRWCHGEITVTGRGCGFDCVPGTGAGSNAPARSLFRVVARFAEPRTVARGGRPAAAPGDDVVLVPDRGVAVRRAAGFIARDQEAPKARREEARAGVQRNELARAGCGVEPSEPEPERGASVSVAARSRSLAGAGRVSGTGQQLP